MKCPDIVLDLFRLAQQCHAFH